MKRLWSLLFVFVLCAACFLPLQTLADDDTLLTSTPIPADQPDLGIQARAACLMEASTGTILYALNPDEELPPASVTKIMTLLLIWEAIDSGALALTDPVTVSAHAASMGGSQVFLAEGETMTVEDLVKCTVIASANDAAVALAEHLMGSEEAFVAKMNARAAELGMEHSHFENVTGLDDDTTNHVFSAHDIAVASQALISHKRILNYSSVWMDTIRDGAFTLTNTNRLIRYYSGATGLKTGSTDRAKFCVSVTAERNGMQLIAVIMGAPSRDVRNNAAKTLLDWGFANYAVYEDPAAACDPIHVTKGQREEAQTESGGFRTVVKKSDLTQIKRTISEQKSLTAPLKRGEVVGTVTYTLGDTVIGTSEIRSCEEIAAISFGDILLRLVKFFLLS